MRTWTRNANVPCKCKMFQSTTQASSIVEGHVMCAARDIAPTSCLAKANQADTTFLQEDAWKSQVLAALTNWCKRWKLPSEFVKDMSSWVDKQWMLHVAALRQDTQSAWNPRQVKEATRLFAGMVLGPADHFPHSLFVACPVHYHKLLRRSFGDPAVFMPCRNGTGTIIQHLQREFEDQHPELQSYKWAFQWNRGLPTARILPKGSKNFAKARPIIAYTKCWHTKASSFLATALYSIMQVLFPAGTTLNINSVTAGLRQAWRYMQQFEQDDPVMIQQDLIGFFNSVSTLSYMHRFTVSSVPAAGTLRSGSGQFDLSGGSQSRHKRPQDLQGPSTFSRFYYKGPSYQTCHGADPIPASVSLLQGGNGYFLSDSRCMHGITFGPSLVCNGCC